MKRNFRRGIKISSLMILCLILFTVLSTFAIYREVKTKNVSLNISKPTFIVSFNSHGGTGGQTQDVTATYGESMPTITSTPPVKTSYNFLGWYSSETGGTKYYNADGSSARSYNLPSDTTLHAHWELAAYRITFNPNGGTVSPTTKDVIIGNQIGSLPIPTKSGYEFLGWYTGLTDGTLIGTTTSGVVPSDDTVYFAHWQKLGATYYSNGGEFTGSNTANVVEYESTSTAPTVDYKVPTRTGYTFNNWNTASDGSGTAYINEQDIIDYVITNNKVLKLYAQWTVKNYTITLNKNGATNTPTASMTATYDSSALTYSGTYVSPSKTLGTVSYDTTLSEDRGSDGATITGSTTSRTIDYSFDGWYTASSGGSKVINVSKIPSLVSGVSGYTDSNGKWKKDSDTTLYAKFIAPVSGATLPTVTKSGLSCGWTNSSTGDTIATINGTKLISGASFIPDASYTLYPVCELDKYFELTYDANDGYFGYPVTTSPTTTNKVTYIVKYIKDAKIVTSFADGVKYREYKKPIRDGYRFDGWATSKTATTATYTDENAAKAIVQTTGSATLYAVWTRVWAENLSYDNTNTGVNCSDAQCMLDYLATKLTNKGITKFKVGDLVQMTPQNSSYTTKTKYTGYGSTQTINPKELNLWRVIRVNSDGTVDAVSEYVSSISPYFGGVLGYKNFSGYLNKLASQYENPRYTVGSRIMGYDGQTEFISDTSYFDGTSIKAGTEWKSSTSETPAEEYLGRGDSLYTTDYDLVKAAYGGTAYSYAKANKVGTSTATKYWLGSRSYSYGSSTNFNFNGRTVYTYGLTDYNVLRRYNSGSWYDGSSSCALRPIITLRSGLTVTGSGTVSDPYVLK